MDHNRQKASLKESVFIFSLFLLALVFIVVASVPSLKNSIKDRLTSSDRKILAKITGSISADGPKITVLKIKTGEQLTLEVFEHDSENQLIPLGKIPLFASKDAYLEVRGNATNLSLTDIDKNGVLEVVAPTYDEQMVPRLNIFEFNSHTRSFDRMNAPEGYEP